MKYLLNRFFLHLVSLYFCIVVMIMTCFEFLEQDATLLGQ